MAFFALIGLLATEEAKLYAVFGVYNTEHIAGKRCNRWKTIENSKYFGTLYFSQIFSENDWNENY